MKLKYIFPSFLVALLFIYGFTVKTSIADNYKVIKVDGRIVFIASGKDMLTGDQFQSDEKLSFKTQDSRAAVISKQKGRFVLTPDVKSGSASNLLPAMNNVSSRAGALINAIDLKNHFADNYLVLKEMELKIGKDVYPMDKDNFFYLQYAHNEEAINKKLAFRGDTLEITPSDIFTIDGNTIDIPLKKAMSLYYHFKNENGDKKSIKVGDFTMVVPDDEELKAELEVITDELKGKDTDKLKNEITAYLNEFYGKPQKENLNDWLKKNLNL